MELPTSLRIYQAELVAELRQVIGSSSLPLYDMMRYHLGWINETGQPQHTSGKLLRSGLCLCVCLAVGGDWRQALPAAAAIELVHNFSLIHDDIEDESVARRHRPTIWQVWGQAQAINAGDAMHALARLAVLRMKERGVSAGKVLLAIQIIDEASLRLCEGQYRDLDYEKRVDITLKEYLDMAADKTGALFQASFHLGALVGTDDEDRIESLRRCGGKLGLAYQIQDDILGVWAETDVTGKPQGNDIRQRKRSLPIVYALDKAYGEQRQRLLDILRQEAMTDESVAAVMDILNDLGAQDYCQRLAESYAQQAISDLEKLGLSPEPGETLVTVANFIVKRQY